MNRKNIISLIVVDIVVLILALGFIFMRASSLIETAREARPARAQVRSLPVKPAAAAPALPGLSTATVAAPSKAPSASSTAVPPKTRRAPTPAAKTETRNISFTYRNSQVKKVEVIGDFNQWIPQALKKGANHTWQISLPLPPGEYAYNFVIDGKPRRDPNNPKVCDVGRGFPNSYLKVRSLSHEQSDNQ